MTEDGRPVGQAVGLGRMAGNGVENHPIKTIETILNFKKIKKLQTFECNISRTADRIFNIFFLLEST